jgi:hypothetical protein
MRILENFSFYFAFLVASIFIVVLNQKNLKEQIKIHLSALAFLLLAVLLTFIFTFLIHPYVAAYVGGFVVFMAWILFTLVYLRPGWSFVFVLALPFCYGGMIYQGSDFLWELGAPKREEEAQTWLINSSLVILSKAAQEYKASCGILPKNLESLIHSDKDCAKWTGYKKLDYRNGDVIRDPWRRNYLYKIIDKDTIEIGSLGADGVPGGDKLNRDIFRSTSILSKN